jgi:hypothetical protein
MKFYNTWQDNITVTMDSLLIGTGWYEVENQDDIYFRWIGPDPKATIHLNPRRDHENRLNIAIHASADEDILEGLCLEADGIPLHTTLGKKRDSSFITTILPADRSKRENEKTVFTLRLPNTLSSSQVKQGHTDNKFLGIALRRIDIFPLSRALFSAQKYSDPEPFDGLCYIRYNPGVRDAVIHGAYASAYEYFIKQDRTGAVDAFELSENFDECPGDLFDILKGDMHEQSRKLEKKYQEEITLLRDIVYRQSDALRALKGYDKE